MFSKLVSMAEMVSGGIRIRCSGKGELRTGEVREVAFSNLWVYLRRAVSPFDWMSLIMGFTIFMIWSVDLCEGRWRTVARAEDSVSEVLYLLIWILPLFKPAGSSLSFGIEAASLTVSLLGRPFGVAFPLGSSSRPIF